MKLPSANVLWSVAAIAIACSSGTAQRARGCQQDADCPSDARCRAGVCAADMPPRARVSGPPSAFANAEVAFDGSSSSDGDDEIVTYTWSVRMVSASCAPDLGVSNGRTFHPVFSCPGEFEVMLVVKDRTGLVSPPAIVPLTVAQQDQKPPNVTLGPELAVAHHCEGVPLVCAAIGPDGSPTVQLQAHGQDQLGSEAVQYHWEWIAPTDLAGAPPAVRFPNGSDGAAPLVSITTGGDPIAGRWRFVVTVTDANGLSTRGEQAVVVQNRAPTITGGDALSVPHLYDASTSRFRAGGTLSFAYSDPDGDPVTPTWQFQSSPAEHCTFGPGPAGSGTFEIACSDPAELIGSVARSIALQVSDGSGASSAAVGWTIAVTNRPPARAGTEVTQVTVPHQYAGGAYLATASLSAFEDPDGDPLIIADAGSTTACSSWSLVRAGTASTATVACRVPYAVSAGGTPPLAQLTAAQRAAFTVKDPWGLSASSAAAVQITDRAPGVAIVQPQPLGIGTSNSCQSDAWLGYYAPPASAAIAPSVTDPDGDPVLVVWGPPLAGTAPCGTLSIARATCASGAASCTSTVLTTCGGHAYDPAVVVPISVTDGVLAAAASFTAQSTCTPP